MMEELDATTRSGFLEIASAAGRDYAHECRIAAYERLFDRDKDFRWHGERWAKAKRNAEFERDYERDNPVACALLREAGIGY